MENSLQILKEELLRIFGTATSERNPRQTAVLKAFAHVDNDLATIMERYIDIAQKNGDTLPFMAESYAFFLDETEKEALFFYQEGHYRYSTLEEVVHQVYANETYMKKYMTGLAISLLLWPQHKQFFVFFHTFLHEHCKRKHAYLEVGAGHGIFCSEAMREGGFSRYDIVDISETSLALTKKMTAEFIDTHEIRFIHADFLQFESEERYDVISISEVLEHVETPQEFLDKSRKLMKDDGRLYLTTCINAPEIDHIYLFRTIQEVEDLFASAGLGIVENLYVPYKSTTIERSERQKLPINVAYILKKI